MEFLRDLLTGNKRSASDLQEPFENHVHARVCAERLGCMQEVFAAAFSSDACKREGFICSSSCKCIRSRKVDGVSQSCAERSDVCPPVPCRPAVRHAVLRFVADAPKPKLGQPLNAHFQWYGRPRPALKVSVLPHSA